MGTQHKSLSDADVQFIKNQKLFYLASSSGKEVNLSPKGYDCIRVLDANTLLFMSYPGSGNRTHTDAVNNGEFTIVFNSFEKKAKILRIFCRAKIVGPGMPRFDNYLELFDERRELVRDFFEFSVYAVETSCGGSVPFMEYKGERPSLKKWVVKMDKNHKLEDYKEDHFQPPDLHKL
ncbi:MAG TPA: pyridoxamine 5'-phosphate oxidase family protein [Desulfobacterales bacterium]|nr:pyridoxamine 5'-phosphate oxidase family protein [Desulfobacterales bacterium]HIP38009.1 pyridoxamine 5'-phosphate oxidase family protein [Desulfocapsa sulfexigens]